MKTPVAPRNPGYKEDCTLYRALWTASQQAVGEMSTQKYFACLSHHITE